jgi:hypothetical protein
MKNKINLAELIKNSNLGMEPQELVEAIVNQYTMSQAEIVDRFHFSNQRLSTMREQNLLKEIKKGLYLREQVEEMRKAQISGKRLEKFGDYKLMPAYDDYVGSLLIDKLRFFDCLTCVNVDSTNAQREKETYIPDSDEYNIHLQEVLSKVIKAFSEGKYVYLFEHRAFQQVRREEDIKEIIDSNKYWVKQYSVKDFLEMLENPLAEAIGFTKVGRHETIVESLKNYQQMKERSNDEY